MRVLDVLKSLALLSLLFVIVALGGNPGPLEAEFPAVRTRPEMVAMAGGLRISGPYHYKNLDAWLIHGEDRVKSPRKIMTLAEAMAQKKVVVHETGEVKELSIENLSDDIDVFIQAGDIVKGGQQDRVISKDMMLPPRSGKIALASFCVEEGRWQQRGCEAVTIFQSCKNSVSSIVLKRAVKVAKSQSDVWKGVTRYRTSLAASCASFELASFDLTSSSSLQLTLESEKLNETQQVFAQALDKQIAARKDVIGYAFAINGEINCADVYGSNDLFKKMWKKLLAASTYEAVSQFKKGHVFKLVPIERVASFLAQTYSPQKSMTRTSSRINVLLCTNTDNYFIETCDDELVSKHGEATWLHRNYLRRSSTDDSKKVEVSAEGTQRH